MHKMCVALIVLLATLVLIPIASEAEEWIPYSPKSDDVTVKWTFNSNVSVIVTITFPHSGFMVCWGPAMLIGDVARVYVEIIMWTGPAAQVITHKSYTWHLPSNVRAFELYINGQLVKSLLLDRVEPQFRDYTIIPVLAGLLAVAVRLLISKV